MISGLRVCLATAVVFAIGVAGPAYAQSVAAMMFKPGHSFAAEQTAPAPDYTTNAAWAALPGADEAGANTTPATATNAFFVHPTTYLDPASWNAAFDNPGKGVGGG